MGDDGDERILKLKADLEARNARLAEANEQLRNLNRLKDRFLAIASHDIKSPLAAVEGYLKIMLEGDVDPASEQGLRWLERCRTRLKSLRRLVTDLLDISKIETGQVLQQRVNVDLDRLAEEVCEMYRPSAEQAGLQLNLEVSGEPPPVTGDPDRLRQVIENLLGNALKFTEEGEVSVRLRAEDPSWIILEVADTGVGISEKNMEHIFEDFFRAKGTRSDGSGLGLAIASRLVEAHGGRIEAESTPGKGSAFTVRLPAADKQ